jgi:hypothetical protein
MFSMYFADFVHCEAVIEISLQRMKFKEWLGFGDTVVKSYDKVIWYCFRRLTIHSVDHIRQVIVVLTFMNCHSSYYCETYNNFILRYHCFDFFDGHLERSSCTKPLISGHTTLTTVKEIRVNSTLLLWVFGDPLHERSVFFTHTVDSPCCIRLLSHTLLQTLCELRFGCSIWESARDFVRDAMLNASVLLLNHSSQFAGLNLAKISQLKDKAIYIYSIGTVEGI